MVRQIMLSLIVVVLTLLLASEASISPVCDFWIDYRYEFSGNPNGTIDDPFSSFILPIRYMYKYQACRDSVTFHLTPGGSYDLPYVRESSQIVVQRCIECPKPPRKESVASETSFDLPSSPLVGSLPDLMPIFEDPASTPSFRAYLHELQSLTAEENVILTVSPNSPILGFGQDISHIYFFNIVFRVKRSLSIPLVQVSTAFGPLNTGSKSKPTVRASTTPSSLDSLYDDLKPDPSEIISPIMEARHHLNLTLENVLVLGSSSIMPTAFISAMQDPGTTSLKNVSFLHFDGESARQQTSLIVVGYQATLLLENVLFYNISVSNSLYEETFSISGPCLFSSGNVFGSQMAFMNSSVYYFQSDPSSEPIESSPSIIWDETNPEVDLAPEFDISEPNDGPEGPTPTPSFTFDPGSTEEYPTLHGGAVMINNGVFELQGGWFFNNGIITRWDQWKLHGATSEVYPAGGALFYGTGSEVYLSNVTFFENTAALGGAISGGSSFETMASSNLMDKLECIACKFRKNCGTLSAADFWTSGVSTHQIVFQSSDFYSPYEIEYHPNAYIEPYRLATSISVQHISNGFAASRLSISGCTFTGNRLPTPDSMDKIPTRQPHLHSFMVVQSFAHLIIRESSFSEIDTIEHCLIYTSHLSQVKIYETNFTHISVLANTRHDIGAFCLNYDDQFSPINFPSPTTQLYVNHSIDFSNLEYQKNDSMNEVTGHSFDSSNDLSDSPNGHSIPIGDKFESSSPEFDGEDPVPASACPSVVPPVRAPSNKNGKASLEMDHVSFSDSTLFVDMIRVSYVTSVSVRSLTVNRVAFIDASFSTFRPKLLFLSDISMYVVLDTIDTLNIKAPIHIIRSGIIDMSHLSLVNIFARSPTESSSIKLERMKENWMMNDDGDDENESEFDVPPPPIQKSVGAITIRQCSSVYMEDSQVIGYTSASRISAVTFEQMLNSVYVVRCMFIRNIATQEGGAISFSSPSPSISTVVLNSTFTANEANAGGAIYSKGAIALIGCSFTGNQAYSGGAVLSSGILVCIHRSEFTSNRANTTGGAVAVASANLFATQNHFRRNLVSDQEGLGGAIALLSTSFCAIDRSIFLNNAAHNGAGIAFSQGGSNPTTPTSNPRSSPSSADDSNSHFMNTFPSDQTRPTMDEFYETSAPLPFRPFFRLYLSNSLFSQNNAVSDITFEGLPKVTFEEGVWPSDLSDQKTHRGGAIYLSEINEINVYRTRFVNNIARVGGAVFVTPEPEVLSFIDSIFSGNNATYAGGAVAIFSKPNVTNSNSPYKSYSDASEMDQQQIREQVSNDKELCESVGGKTKLDIQQTTFTRNGAGFGGVFWLATHDPMRPLCISNVSIHLNSAYWGAVMYHSGYEETIPKIRNANLTKNFAYRAAPTIFFNGPPLTSLDRFSEFCHEEFGCKSLGDKAGTRWGNSLDTSSATSGFNLTVCITPQYPSSVHNLSLSTMPFAYRHDPDPPSDDLQNSAARILATNGNCLLVDADNPWIDSSTTLFSNQPHSTFHKPETALLHPGNLSIDFILRDALDQLTFDQNTYSTCFAVVENEHQLVSVLTKPGSINSAMSTSVGIALAVRSDHVNQTDSLYRPGRGSFSVSATLVVGLENTTVGASATTNVEPYRFKALPLTMLPFNLTGCPRGHGLASLNSDPEWAVCEPCTEGTYNFDGDGFCWLCDDPTIPYSLVTCSGDSVRPTSGVYVVPSPSDNTFHTYICPFGYCTNCSQSSFEVPHASIPDEFSSKKTFQILENLPIFSNVLKFIGFLPENPVQPTNSSANSLGNPKHSIPLHSKPFETPKPKTCPFGDCVEGRDPNSCLCGACASGYTESLMFDRCSSQWCQKPNVLAIIIFFLILTAVSLLLHQLWFYYPSKTSILLFFIQVLPLLRVDWTLLVQKWTPGLAAFFCLAPASPLHRIIFQHLIPIYMAVVLVTIFILHRITVLGFKHLRSLFRLISRSEDIVTSNSNHKDGSSFFNPYDESVSRSRKHERSKLNDKTSSRFAINDDSEEKMMASESSESTDGGDEDSMLSKSDRASGSEKWSSSSSEEFGMLGKFKKKRRVVESLSATDFIIFEESEENKFLADRPSVKLSRSLSEFSLSSASGLIEEEDMDETREEGEMESRRKVMKRKVVSEWDQRVVLPFFHSARLVRSLLALWVLTIIPSMRLVGDFAHCVEIVGRPTVWFPAPSIHCSSSSFIILRNVTIPIVAISLTLLLCIFIYSMKLYQQIVLGQNQKIQVLLHLAYLFDSYRPGLYFWLFLHILERIYLPLTVSFSFVKTGPFNFATSLGLLFATLIQAFAWSYTDPWDNLLSCVSLAILTLTSLLRDSTFQSSVIDYASPPVILTNYLIWLLLIFIMIAIQIGRRIQKKHRCCAQIAP